MLSHHLIQLVALHSLLRMHMEKDIAIEELNSWLGESDESNWTEYSAELVAKTVLYKFKKTQWSELKKIILSKPDYWQQRCATTLGEDRSEEAIDILKLLLSDSQYIETKIIAIYELDWAEVSIEQKYAQHIRNVISHIPENDLEPELQRLLIKAETQETVQK
jgi:hypothetical protein